MNINLTLFGQMITFALFVWFTMAFVWPPIMRAIKEREEKIAKGLAAAAEGEKSLEVAEHQVNEILRDAKAQAVEIIEHANKRSDQIVEEAKVAAKEEGSGLLRQAEANIRQEYDRAREDLKQKVGQLVVAGAEKILREKIDEKAHAKLIDELVESL